jgi:hypothetical protein
MDTSQKNKKRGLTFFICLLPLRGEAVCFRQVCENIDRLILVGRWSLAHDFCPGAGADRSPYSSAGRAIKKYLSCFSLFPRFNIGRLIRVDALWPRKKQPVCLFPITASQNLTI